MRILLIEDFGKREGFEDYIRDVFIDLLGEQTIREHWDDDERNLKKDSRQLLSFFQNYSRHHEAVLCRYWSEFENTKTQWDIVRDFDVILIDINLSDIWEDELQKPVPTGYLPEKGGFYIYNELIRQGFSDDNIGFLTGEEDTLASFITLCHEMSLPEPLHSFKKKDEGFKAVREWLKSKQSDDFLTLRRGILNVLHDIEAQNIPLTPPFADEDDPVDAPTFLNGLAYLLKHTLKEPAKQEQQSLFLTLCDSMTKPLERFSKELLFRGVYRGKNTEVLVNKAYLIPAYLVRNWIAHGVMNHLQTPLSAQDTAFLFMLVTKSLFDYSCLEVFKSLYAESTVTDQALTRKLSDLHEYYSYPNECDIFELIRVKGEKKLNPNWQQEPFIANFYASFLFNSLKSV